MAEIHTELPAPTLQPDGDPPVTAAPGRRSRILLIIAVVLLFLGFAAALTFLVMSVTELEATNERVEQQQRELEEQRDLIEKKETFSAAMQSLMDTAGTLDGLAFESLVPIDYYQRLADRAWDQRWRGEGLDSASEAVLAAHSDLEQVIVDAEIELAGNASGTTYEAVTDALGSGFVLTFIDDADALCFDDVLACVTSDDPNAIHFDAKDTTLPYMTDWIRTGIAYHEFAHVLQFTNPAPTELALASFGGDMETMADCFALTALEGWTLDHRIWENSSQYWDVEIGYGHTCDETQRQVVRDWREQLGFRMRSITQS